MKKKLTANLGLKILAVLFSIAIWFIVVNINDPVDKTVFRNVPVEILHSNAVTDQGKVYEILDSTDTIDVTVWAKRSILDTLGRDNIIATADMQEINFMDTMVRIKLATNKYNDKLESISSATENMLIRIEDMRREQFVIATTTVGEPAQDYILGNVSADQNLDSVSGTESIVSSVARAEVSVDVEGLSQDIRTDATIRLYDAENVLIEDKNLKKSLDQVKVNIEILQTKRVPLAFSVSGVPTEGYALTGVVESSPSTVQIAGKGNTIKNISQIEIPDTALNVTGYSSDMSATIELKKYLPENIVLADGSFHGKVSVKVHIEKEESVEMTLAERDISMMGLPISVQGSLELEEPLVVELTGLAEDLEALEDTRLTAVVDAAAYMEKHSLEELTAGVYVMPLTMTLPEDVRQKQEYTVTVTVKDRNAEHNNEE